MRTLALAVSALLAAPALLAQANDYAGLRVYTSNSAGAPTPLVCGTPFTCTPFSFATTAGSTVTGFVSGNFNEVYIIAASVDTTTMLCLPLGVPGLVNNYALTPGTEVIVALGICTVPDNGRCNGGASPARNQPRGRSHPDRGRELGLEGGHSDTIRVRRTR